MTSGRLLADSDTLLQTKQLLMKIPSDSNAYVVSKILMIIVVHAWLDSGEELHRLTAGVHKHGW